MALERFIDYMQFSSHLMNEFNCIDLKYAACNPVKNYNRGYIAPHGYRIFFSNNSKNTPILIASGSVMQNFRDYEITDEKVLEWAFQMGAKFSRIDLAVTESVTEFEPEIFTMNDVKRWITERLIESPLISGGQKGIVDFAPKDNEGGENIETIYVGDMKNRAKKGIFRAYDKGLEIGGIAANMISRIELEIKRERAQVTARKLSEKYDIAGNFRARFEVKDPEFERIMDAPAIEIKRGKGVKNSTEKEELEKRWAWLINQVAPAIEKAIKESRKLGRGDDDLNKFLSVSGLSKEMRKQVKVVSEYKYSQTLLDNGLVDITKK